MPRQVLSEHNQMSHLGEMGLLQAANLRRVRDSKQEVLAEESSGPGNSKMSRLEVGIQIIESEPGIITATFQPLVFRFQCHICGWEYMADGRCERCGN